MIVSYARTSTVDQAAGFEAQQTELRNAGAGKLFSEQASSVGQRPQLEAALEFVREGDVFMVTRLDRLARSTQDLLQIVDVLERKKVSLRILNLGVDTGTPTGKLLLTMLGAIAQFEREIMLERQREGIRKAHREGKYKGRAPTAQRQADEVLRLKGEGLSPTEITKKLKISRASVYRILSSGTA